jgi:hypothetical protein
LIKIDKYIILPLNDCDWQECYFDLSWLWLTGILFWLKLTVTDRYIILT